MNGTFRKGFPEAQRGRLIAAAGNGFHVFASETGAEFTVRAEEFTADSDSKAEAARKREIVASWPRGCNQFRIIKPAGRAASLAVTLTRRERV
jgi:hypothetical protein